MAGLRPFVKRYFFEFASDHDKELVADFVLSCIRQENITSNTRRAYIVAIATMARYFFKGEKKKDISSITSKDLTGYFNSMQRDENQNRCFSLCFDAPKQVPPLASKALTGNQRKDMITMAMAMTTARILK
jgi:hypothetical protein